MTSSITLSYFITSRLENLDNAGHDESTMLGTVDYAQIQHAIEYELTEIGHNAVFSEILTAVEQANNGLNFNCTKMAAKVFNEYLAS